MLKYLFSVFLVLGLGSGFARANGAGGSQATRDDATYSEIMAEIKALNIDYTKRDTVTEDALRKLQILQKKAEVILKRQLEDKKSTACCSSAALEQAMADANALQDLLNANEADIATSDKALEALHARVDSMTKIPAGGKEDLNAYLQSAKLLRAEASVDNKSARTNAKAAQADNYLNALEMKMDKEEMGAYVREKFAKFINSTPAACGMVNRCLVKAPTPVDPKTLDDVFSNSDPDKTSKESYQKMRKTSN